MVLSLIKKQKYFNTALILHADHGGGNNSTFTNVVISSTGTDIYIQLFLVLLFSKIVQSMVGQIWQLEADGTCY